MDSQATHIITIANSIIGVSILAMPYCFKQCGIVLSILILVVSSILSRLSCHFLLKSAIISRLKTFEFLAFHAFGSLGKFIVEIGMIGFLMGTCVAFFVVMGDLAPAILAKIIGSRATDTLRTSILMALALFCVLPLGLLRNVDSLSSVCTATVGFYFCLVLKIIGESTPHIFSGDWMDKVYFWRPAGILQCLPIFSMALFCQTQIFEIYQAIPNASLDKMNHLIRVAVNICTGVYIFVGSFGYIAFSQQSFSGNILMSFTPSILSEAIKIGFVLSLAFSFPLIIFPCRASLYSLLYKPTYLIHEGMNNYIPEGKFKGLTFIIVLFSLVTGVLIPNIELVLGLVGSTIGIMICVLFPVTCFICLSSKNTNERILAQLLLFFGVLIMVLGTYANLYAMEKIVTNTKNDEVNAEILKGIEDSKDINKVIDIPTTVNLKPPLIQQPIKQPEIEEVNDKQELVKEDEPKEIRHEPPQPVEPEIKLEDKKLEDAPAANEDDRNGKEVKDEAVIQENVVQEKNKEDSFQQDKPMTENKPDVVNSDAVKEINLEPIKEIRHEPPQPEAPVDGPVEVKEKQPKKSLFIKMNPDLLRKKLKSEEQNNDILSQNGLKVKQDENEVLQPMQALDEPRKTDDKPVNDLEITVKKLEQEVKKTEEVDIEAIKKEDNELELNKEKISDEEKAKVELLKSLEKQNQEQKKIVEQQKEILEQIKKQQQALKFEKQMNEIEKVNEEKVKAVKQIESIAKKAIESLSGNAAGKENQMTKSSNEENKDDTPAKLQLETKLSNVGLNMTNPNVEPNAENNFKRYDSEIIKKEQSENSIRVPNNDGIKKEQLQNLIPVPNNEGIRKEQLENLIPMPNNDRIKKEKLENLIPVPNNEGIRKEQLENLIPIPIAKATSNLSLAFNNQFLNKNKVEKQQNELENNLGKNEKLKNEGIAEQLMKNKDRDHINNLFDVLNIKVNKTNNLADQDKVVIHREIRSADEDLKIADNIKQNIETVDLQNNNNIALRPGWDNEHIQVVKVQNNSIKERSVLENEKRESCDKDDRLVKETVNTDSPLIKMMSKLSEPEVVSIGLPIVEIQNFGIPINSIGRDLKSYKSRRKK